MPLSVSSYAVTRSSRQKWTYMDGPRFTTLCCSGFCVFLLLLGTPLIVFGALTLIAKNPYSNLLHEYVLKTNEYTKKCLSEKQLEIHGQQMEMYIPTGRLGTANHARLDPFKLVSDPLSESRYLETSVHFPSKSVRVTDKLSLIMSHNMNDVKVDIFDISIPFFLEDTEIPAICHCTLNPSCRCDIRDICSGFSSQIFDIFIQVECVHGAVCGTCWGTAYLGSVCLSMDVCEMQSNQVAGCAFPLRMSLQQYTNTAPSETVNIIIKDSRDPSILKQRLTHGVLSFGVSPSMQSQVAYTLLATGAACVVLSLFIAIVLIIYRNDPCPRHIFLRTLLRLSCSKRMKALTLRNNNNQPGERESALLTHELEELLNVDVEGSFATDFYGSSSPVLHNETSRDAPEVPRVIPVRMVQRSPQRGPVEPFLGEPRRRH